MIALFGRANPLTCARWLIVAVMVSLLFSPPLVALAQLALFVCLASSGELRRRLIRTARQPMVMATLALIVVIMIGSFYSIGSPHEAMSMLTGWRKLLFLPIAAALFDEPRWKDRLCLILVAVVSICVVGSYAGFFVDKGIYLYPPGIIIRNHATQGMMFSVAAFVAITFLSTSPTLSRAWKFLLAAAATLLVANVIFVTPGRSGYAVLLVCTAAFAFDLMRRQRDKSRWSVGLSVLLLAVVIGSLAISPIVRDRIGQGVREMETYKTSSELTSMGVRMVLWQNTLEIIAGRPVLGYGTGSFGEAYRRNVVRKMAGQSDWQAVHLSSDPHNQYLKIAAEHGIVGLMVFVLFILSAFRQQSASPYRLIGIGVLLSWCATSLFSSHFSTFSEGNFIALWCGAMLSQVEDDGSADT